MNEKYLNEGCWRGGRSMLSFIENIIGPDLHIERVKRSGRGQLSLSVWPLSLSLCVCQAVMQTSSLVFNLHVRNCLSLQRICLSLLFSVCLSLTPHTLNGLFFQGVSCFLSLNSPAAYEQLPVRLKLFLAVMRSPPDTQSHSAVFSSAMIHFWVCGRALAHSDRWCTVRLKLSFENRTWRTGAKTNRQYEC